MSGALDGIIFMYSVVSEFFCKNKRKKESPFFPQSRKLNGISLILKNSSIIFGERERKRGRERGKHKVNARKRERGREGSEESEGMK